MEPRTRQHLTKAARNRDLALWLLNAASPISGASPPLEWAAVVAFYAAVHYVNAYLWETRRYEPRDHRARVNAVGQDRVLRAAYRSYMGLRTLAFQSRYHPSFRPTHADAEYAVGNDLAQVERTVQAALPRLTS